MVSSAAMTTLRIGRLAPRVVLIAVTASVALWLYAESGRPALPVLAMAAIAVAAAAELLAGRHLLDIGVVGDEFVVVRRRIWQHRSRGREERFPREAIQGVGIVRSTRSGTRGARYRISPRVADGLRGASCTGSATVP